MRQLTCPQGNFFEDFVIDQEFIHGIPKTITQADASLYHALTADRNPLHCAETVAQVCGFKTMPIDNLLVFHIAFGKTVNDISLNAIANLGYAELKFHKACFAGDTLSVTSKVIGLKQNSNGKSGIVYVHSKATNQFDELVVSWKRWVMVNKKSQLSQAQTSHKPVLETQLSAEQLSLPQDFSMAQWQDNFSENQRRFDDWQIGDRLFHGAGITINDSDHSMATRLYQNNAKVHFDQHLMQQTPAAKRLVYGGHIISLCRSLSFNGLGNALWLAAINGGTHANPSFAGDTLYSHSEILDLQPVADRSDLGAVRIRLTGYKNDAPKNIDDLISETDGRRKFHKNLVLELDYWSFMVK